MEPEILIDALVQLAGLEGEMAVCRARLTQSERMTERLLGLDREYAADTATADRHRSQAEARTSRAVPCVQFSAMMPPCSGTRSPPTTAVSDFPCGCQATSR